MSSDRGDPLVSVQDVGKCYHIYSQPRDRLMQTLFRGKRQFYREFWALRGVGFDLRRGESLGIVGRNGSGKSTLLQVIAGTLAPTEGQVQVRGRVGALLELGSGFNPEYTGRENVFMCGAIMGFSPAQIAERFDEIAAFASIGDFLHQPVKTYSSGMVVRLAFAMNVLMEPDILIVDEALAVGDAAFQVKCMTLMKRLMARGLAIVLVTHDVATVRSFCNRALWLRDGRVAMAGSTLDVTSRYTEFLFAPEAGADGPPAAPLEGPAGVSPQAVPAASPTDPHPAMSAPEAPAFPVPVAAVERPEPLRSLISLEDRPDVVRWGSGQMRISGVAMDAGTPGAAAVFEHGCPLHLELEATVQRPLTSPDIGLGFAFRNTKGLDIITCTTWEAGLRLEGPEPGRRYRLAFDLENILAPGEYALVANVEYVSTARGVYLDFVENALIFTVLARQRIFSLTLPRVRQRLVQVRVEPVQQTSGEVR